MESILTLENVSISYKIGDFKDIGLKEWTMRHLKKRYHVETFMAVNDVSFSLEKGDMLGIIGTNGAGKSTLLKAITGVMEPRSGTITRNGHVVALLELASGFDGDLSVKENAYLRGAMLGYTREYMDKVYREILDFSELWSFEDRPFKQLSTGMQSRLAFSIASMVQPEILVLDEVLSVGDGAFQEKSAKKMMEIIQSGSATILVSHSLEQIRTLCNKVLWLDHGSQISFGKSKHICDAYEAFLAAGCMDAMAFMKQYAKPEKNLASKSDIDESKSDDEKANVLEESATGEKNLSVVEDDATREIEDSLIEDSLAIEEEKSAAEESVNCDEEIDKRTDVINCYRYILGRDPECDDVVQGSVQAYTSHEELRRRFLLSEEFQSALNALMNSVQEDRGEKIADPSLIEALLSNSNYLSRLRFILSQTKCVWGDPARLDIHPTVILNDAILNTNSGTITIGAYSFTGHGSSILTGTHFIERKDKARMDCPRTGRDIVIGKGVWMASGCTILGPCRIGDYAVIAAGAVVAPGTEIPAGTLWGGHPAKQIRNIDFEEGTPVPANKLGE